MDARDGVLGKLSREDETDRSLNLAGRDGRFLVVGRELGCLGRDALKDVVDERVEDEHGPAREKDEDEVSDGRRAGRRRRQTHLLEIPVSGWTCLRTL